MAYEKADLVIGIGMVLARAIAIMAFAAAAFQGTDGFGQFTDAGALAQGLEARAGAAGVMFALALLDASISPCVQGIEGPKADNRSSRALQRSCRRPVRPRSRDRLQFD
jgi:Mn2+/Fe2+ NRAMP family transporter